MMDKEKYLLLTLPAQNIDLIFIGCPYCGQDNFARLTGKQTDRNEPISNCLVCSMEHHAEPNVDGRKLTITTKPINGLDPIGFIYVVDPE